MSVKIYELVTERIIAMLEDQVIPWRKPWACIDQGMPRNAVSKKHYRGINVFLLGMAPFNDPRWVTFKQAQALGGNVRKGSKGFPVIYWNWIETEDEETGTMVKIPLLRQYTVFNVEQCDGLNIAPLESAELPNAAERIERAEGIVRDMPNAPRIGHDGGQRAYYRPSTDSVHMPMLEAFHSTEGYYSTLFHELGHSTGHESRLNRDGITDFQGFGTASYSREELVAEFTAAFLCQVSGIENTLPQSASYIEGWLGVLRKDKKMAVVAAAQAQKAADYILGGSAESFDTEDGE